MIVSRANIRAMHMVIEIRGSSILPLHHLILGTIRLSLGHDHHKDEDNTCEKANHGLSHSGFDRITS